MLFALSTDRSNSQSDFCRKGPLFLERVTFFTPFVKENMYGARIMKPIP